MLRMNLFEGFSNMSKYFTLLENDSMDIESEKSNLSESKTQNLVKTIEKEKKEILTIKELNENILKNIKIKENEMIVKIEEKMIEHELSSTGKIKCDTHYHKSVDMYKRCVNKNDNYARPRCPLIYFDDINDKSFKDKVEEFFELFPEKMKKSIDPSERYKRYQSYYDNIILIENLCTNKKELYKKSLNLLVTKYNVKIDKTNDNTSDDSDNNSNNSDNDDNNKNNNNTDNLEDEHYYQSD